ncbi:type III pantothenate kinase [Deferribacter desulfuricans SSM1]|uniref:Type III pantothenate kinase n=1 Tax=Deferribacter desulfuricans (strain DSM 14783 / JCM 11476 / NBRC 101012 / SSM1) TaxID=639282 RepID=D3P8I1_DEFDS|nr:type III pantothenate kinase [Deferribacter desulfuricans]BAI81021.1 type III pantothenate kinase [Deferribacter desulfuricans SSM1]
MILAIDIGNTNIVLGVFKDETLIANFRLATDHFKTTDEYASIIMLLMEKNNIDIKGVRGVIISSVVPSLIYTFSKLCRKYINSEPIVVGPGVKTGVKIHIDNPREVGADRIVNAAAAINKYGAPVIVVDFGTATTFDVVDKNSCYVGGLICPGIKLSIKALHTGTAKLPEVEIEKPDRVVGTNTIRSIQSGIYYGYLSMVDGIIEKIIDELGCDIKNLSVITTGGLGSIFVRESKYLKVYEPNLTLEGLRIIYEKNC